MDLQKMIEEEALVFDLETPKGCFLACFSPVHSTVYIEFLVNEYQNDLYKLVKFLELNKHQYFKGFNNINFDNQILEYIMENYEKWFDLTGKEIAAKIAAFGGRIIEDQNYGLFLPYREERMQFKPIDAPRILHWFNENRRVSLKQAEFELRAENIQNFEISPDKEDFTPEEVQDLIFYCRNDVHYTKEVFMHVLGKTDHPLYKGRNKVADRVNFMKEYPDLKCLNWDDVKLGAEWNKYDYLKLSGKREEDLKPKKVNHFYGKKYKVFFPPTVEFRTAKVLDFVKKLGETYILKDKQEFKIEFDDLVITIARGGLHSSEKPRILRPNADEVFLQNDIGSQYPKAIEKFNAGPKHLPGWVGMIVEKIKRRLGFKKKYKETKDPVYNSLQETGKYALNGGAYGRMGTPGDWQEDPCAMLTVTLGCQLEILMIVEGLILRGFNVTSCNTDGWDCIIPKSRLDEYFQVVEDFEDKILAERGTIEFTVFDWMVQTSVNDYIAKKAGVYEERKFKEDRIVTKESAYPDMKLKGDFTIDFELHKNSSFRIIPLALVKYFTNGTNPEDFINSHTDIFDFCARSNSGSTYYHECYRDSKSFQLPKLIRYYVSKDGVHIKKVVKEEADTNANDQNVQPKDYVKTVCNSLPVTSYKSNLSNVNRTFYIDKVKEIIYKIETGKKPKRGAKVDPNQGSLF